MIVCFFDSESLLFLKSISLDTGCFHCFQHDPVGSIEIQHFPSSRWSQMSHSVTTLRKIDCLCKSMSTCRLLLKLCKDCFFVLDCERLPRFLKAILLDNTGCFHCFQQDPVGSIDIQHFPSSRWSQMSHSVTALRKIDCLCKSMSTCSLLLKLTGFMACC